MLSRRSFIKYAALAGASMCMESCTPVFDPPVSSDTGMPGRDLLNDLIVADAHAHPERFHTIVRREDTIHSLEEMKQARVAVSAFNAVGDHIKYRTGYGWPFHATYQQLSHVRELVKLNQADLVLGRSDIPSPYDPDRPVGAVMAIEGGDALEGKIENLTVFHDYGVRMIGVMHNHNNEIGVHQKSSTDGGLTPFGVKLIETMNDTGMIVDVAHANTRTLQDIARVTQAPLIDSHTSPIPKGRSGGKPTRLRSWNEMEVVAKTGGVIGLWPLAYSHRSHPRTTLQHWAKEIVLMKQRLGIEHCGLGTDGGGGLPQKVRGWTSIASLPNLVLAMLEAGLSRNDVRAFCGGNFIRVLNTCLA